MSFVRGAENVAFLRERFAAMSAHHCYHGMEYTEDHQKIAEWAPLIMEGRAADEPGCRDAHHHRHRRGLRRADPSPGRASVPASPASRCTIATAWPAHRPWPDGALAGGCRDTQTGAGCSRDRPNSSSSARVVARCRCCRNPASRKAAAMAAFRSAASGCAATIPAISKRHHAKVYGKAAVGSPPMSVPHLDTRIIGGQHSLLFGPYAGFSSKFLKHGSLLDLFESIETSNIIPLLSVARDNFALTEYLIGQLLQTPHHRFAMLQDYYPNAARSRLAAGRSPGSGSRSSSRIMEKGGLLEFGTELVAAADKLARGAARRIAWRVDRGVHRDQRAGEVLRQ